MKNSSGLGSIKHSNTFLSSQRGESNMELIDTFGAHFSGGHVLYNTRANRKKA